MNLSCQQGTVQTGINSIMMLGVFQWPKHVIHWWILCWTATCSFASIHWPRSNNSNRLVQQNNPPYHRTRLPRTGFRYIEKTFHKCHAHNVHPTWCQSNIYLMWWRGLFARKILYLQISGSSGLFSRWHSSTSLQWFSDQIWNRYPVKLLNFAELEDVYPILDTIPWLLTC